MTRLLLCIVSALLWPGVVGCSTPQSGDVPQGWAQFRGPTGQGIAAQANPPLHWDGRTNVVWDTEIPGRGWSSPIVHQGRIFVTTASLTEGGEPNSLRLLCLDFDLGNVLWDRELFTPEAPQSKHVKNSHASSTPIAEGNRVYAHFGHMGVACVNVDGEVIWRQTSLKYPPNHGNGGSPILVGDRLIFSCDGESDPFIAALDIATGAVLWKTERHTDAEKKFSFSTPLLVQEDHVVVSPGSGAAFAYNPTDGSEVWRVDYGQGYSVVPRPVTGHGMVYVTSGFNRPTLYAIRLGGHGDVTDSHVVWTSSRGAPLTPSMLLVGEELYFVSDSGIASCVDALTGKAYWQERIGGDVSASPIYAQGRIYITNEQGKTVVIKAGKEFEILAENNLGERILASGAMVGDSLLLRTESRLYRLQER